MVKVNQVFFPQSQRLTLTALPSPMPTNTACSSGILYLSINLLGALLNTLLYRIPFPRALVTSSPFARTYPPVASWRGVKTRQKAVGTLQARPQNFYPHNVHIILAEGSNFLSDFHKYGYVIFQFLTVLLENLRPFRFLILSIRPMHIPLPASPTVAFRILFSPQTFLMSRQCMCICMGLFLFIVLGTQYIFQSRISIS